MSLILRSLAFLALTFHLHFLAPLPAAPLPPHRPRPKQPPPDVTAGNYTLIWAGSSWHMALHKDGAYEATTSGTRWVGSWSYCPKQRAFHVMERPEGGETWLNWVVILCPKLTGGARMGTEQPATDQPPSLVPLSLIRLPEARAQKGGK